MAVDITRGRSGRIRSAQEALLGQAAALLLAPAREVICEPTRTQIVRVLCGGQLSVGDLASVLNRSKSATSQHLRVLRDGGVVTARRRGRTVFYSLARGPMIDAIVSMLDTAAALAKAA